MKTAALLVFLCLCFTPGRAQHQTVGLFTRTQAADDGYVLFAPLYSKNTYLIDKCGRQVHSWTSRFNPANSVYLLKDGRLLHTGNAGNPTFPNGGYIELLDWDGNVSWSYELPGNLQSQHHDVCMLPNGHILVLAWETKFRQDALAAGRDSAMLGNTLWTEKILELEPIGANDAQVVWEWSVWDHLIQEHDPAAMNYGTVAAHPELVDLNYKAAAPQSADWLHANGLAYNEALDQIMLSVYWTNEFWIIDHSTSTAEAATHQGGKRGKGGDLLYRWGNPRAYGRGSVADQKLFRLHNAHWIPSGLPHAGRVLVFNNGDPRPDSQYSTVNEITLPADATGAYPLTGTTAFGPPDFSWEYKAPVATDFFAPILSGAQRLRNGNTLICEGTKGNFIEVDSSGATVWRYVSPVSGDRGAVAQGETPDQSMVFRCPQYAADYPGLNGHSLAPGAPIELNPLPNAACAPPDVLASESAALPGRTFHAINPFSDRIGLDGEETEGRIEISLLNCLGTVCERWTLELHPGRPASIGVPPSLSPGIYFLRIDDGFRHTVLKLQHI